MPKILDEFDFNKDGYPISLTKGSGKLKSKYGITKDDYNRMLKEQNSRCAICGKISKLGVDHNHKTNKVRALLCNNCNLILGYCGDNKEILICAIEYLNIHEAI